MNFLCHNLEFWKVVESLPPYLRIHAFFIGILYSDDARSSSLGFGSSMETWAFQKPCLTFQFIYSSRFSGTRSNTWHILIYVFV